MSFEEVTFGYNGVPILKNVSFTVNPGQTVALVGQTGSGKTTLTRLINRIFDVGDGTVRLDGVDVRDWSLEAKLTVSPTNRYERRLGLPILAAKASPVWIPIPWFKLGQPFVENCLLSSTKRRLISSAARKALDEWSGRKMGAPKTA